MLNRHRKLRMERMEARQMMAGDITATVVNGNLFLNEKTGQAGLDNSVLISQTDTGKIHVQGAVTADGSISKINGLAAQDFDVPGGLFVKFGAGNDTVKLINGIGVQINLREIQIDVAAPEPVITRSAFPQATSFTALTRPDTDIVFMEHFHTVGSVSIKTGDGNDTVTMIDALVGEIGGTPANLTINTGAGVDLVSMKPNRRDSHITGTLDVQTFKGLESDRDFVFIERLGVERDLHVRTGGGDDTISMSTIGAKKLDFDAGAGGDTAILKGVSAVDSLMARLGEGDDTLSTQALFTNDLQLLGDGGNLDRLTKKADVFVGKRTQSGWEYINGLPVLAPATT